MHRILVLLALLAIATPAAADPIIDVDLSASGGAGVMFSDPCGGPFSEADCTTPRVRLSGPSATLRAGLGSHHMTSRRWGLRWSGVAQGMFVRVPGAQGMILSGGGQFGAMFDRFFADVFSGLSFVRVEADGMAPERGATLAFGADAGIAITPWLSAFARVDASAIMEGSIGGAYAGAGLGVHL